MGFVTGAGKLVLALAIAIGVIGKFKPTLFLKIPLGFIPWAITGNPMPPYFDASPFEEGEFNTWARDGDLVVSAGAKSGTNWMLYCAHQVRHWRETRFASGPCMHHAPCTIGVT